ncbi:MAG: aminoacyl-tRNA hydrolase [Candidatus Paceibacterota bacterium]
MSIIFGLGNIGEEYKNTRHNAGVIISNLVEKKLGDDKKYKFVEIDNFMNNSGKTISYYIKNQKDLSKLVVIYDDIDLPLGKIKISFKRSSGGHNGVGNIIKVLKSEEFLRIRIGICPTTPTGKNKKPKGEDKILKFLLGEFKKEELDVLKKVAKKVTEAIEVIEKETYQKAMTLYN